MSKGLLLSISGPSGVGKGTVIAAVREKLPEIGHSISVTSRPKRGAEQEGVEYFFRTKDEFLRMAEEGEILEYDEYVGNFYGTPLTPLMKMTSEGKDVLLDLTVAGSMALKDKYDEAVTIFLLPPTLDALRTRLTGRGTESVELIEKRLSEAKGEIAKANRFDYVVVNDVVEETAASIIAILRAEHLRYSRNTSLLEQYQ
ncbi:MAG TPA: guanylate kinase [Bacillota bacterium]|nr:guanylate kinase [Bacillota bacterium]HPE38677.1 guanylate kinase [Bacillota bacterium]